MIYRTLGRTGAKVSAIALGCEGFVGKTQDEAREMVDYAVGNGINVMNHSDIDIICAEPFQKIGESLFRFRKITRPFILSILPYGTEMRLR